MENHKEYKGFEYMGWQSALNRTNPEAGFHIYLCTKCRTSVTEEGMTRHTPDICDSIMEASKHIHLEEKL